MKQLKVLCKLEEINKAYLQGKKARRDNIPMEHNPYQNQKGISFTQFNSWNRGWLCTKKLKKDI